MKDKRKKAIYVAAIVGLVCTALYGLSFGTLEKEYEPTWHVVGVIESHLLPLGENDPGGSASGWISTFLLDYGETPGTVLQNNATDWSAAGTAMGYVDTDDTGDDIVSEDPFYPAVRCRFNDTVKSGANFMGNRCRATLTVGGDETIAGVALTGDMADTTNGDGVVSTNGTDYIWINFYWDDNSDGYRILDDGALTWAVIIETKY